jgi:hypothetical protein
LENSAAETCMNVGVQLRTQLVAADKVPSQKITTGGAHRAHATNLGIISFKAQMSTKVKGGAVTDRQDAQEWTVTLVLPGSPSAKTEEYEDTELVVTKPNQTVVFRTLCKLEDLFSDSQAPTDVGHYQSLPLDISATTL